MGEGGEWGGWRMGDNVKGELHIYYPLTPSWLNL